MADEQQAKKADEQQAQPEVSIRRQQQLARMERVRKGVEVSRVRVTPRDDTVRALIRHPRGGKFRSVGDIEWPNDRFTQRRIAEGSVTVSPPPEKPEEASAKSGKASRDSVTAA
jgi:hypothetical protein